MISIELYCAHPDCQKDIEFLVNQDGVSAHLSVCGKHRKWAAEKLEEHGNAKTTRQDEQDS